ncbi:MAG: diguanylate cyclase [Synergistaceae bacterium]|jgi:diguanylate cyclase (GGDEF)-like protein/PAS domain S-box-containing protein|nr:diguanylate cyclase [Synergistaceae bacterium]
MSEDKPVISGLSDPDVRDVAITPAEIKDRAPEGGRTGGLFPCADLSGFIKNLNEIIFIVDEKRRITAASDAALGLLGIDDLSGSVHAIDDYMPKVYIDAITQRVKEYDAKGMKLTFPVKKHGGGEVLLEARFNWFSSEEKNYLTISCRDINDLMKMMSDISEREDRYRTIFRESPLGFIHINSDGYITDCNNAFLDIFKLGKFELLGVCIAEDNDLDIYPRFKKAAMDAVVGISSSHESKFASSGGAGEGWVRVSFSPVISENRAFLGAVGIVEDITEAKTAVDRISFVSSHDVLTGLYNRRACEEAIRIYDRQEYLPLGIIYADLNCLKLANDAFGHEEGDILLKTAADILLDNTGSAGEAYRWGGDEFILILKNTSALGVKSCVNRIGNSCENWPAHGFIAPSISLGSAVKLYNDQKLDDIIKEAEDMMYSSKLRSGNETRARILGSLEATLHGMEDGLMGRRARRMMLWGEWVIENIDPDCDHKILMDLCRFHDVGMLAHPEEIAAVCGGPREGGVADPMNHMAVGCRIARCIAEIAPAADYILSHHEWWDGMGYPNQQRGSEIPLVSRIVSILDSLEGILSLNKTGAHRSLDDALDMIRASSGRQFDPVMTASLVSRLGAQRPKFLTDLEC